MLFDLCVAVSRLLYLLFLVFFVVFALLVFGFQFNITNVFRAVFAALFSRFSVTLLCCCFYFTVYCFFFFVLLRFFNQSPRTSDPGFNNGRQQRLTLILTIADRRLPIDRLIDNRALKLKLKLKLER